MGQRDGQSNPLLAAVCMCLPTQAAMICLSGLLQKPLPLLLLPCAAHQVPCSAL